MKRQRIEQVSRNPFLLSSIIVAGTFLVLAFGATLVMIESTSSDVLAEEPSEADAKEPQKEKVKPQAEMAKKGKKKVGDWLLWGGHTNRNMTSDETNMPAEWDIHTGTNVKWVANMGSQTYGNPVISNGKILVGSNNTGNHRPGIEGDKGVIFCFEQETGEMLWQATHDKLPTGRVNDWPEQGICSGPQVIGNRAYYVSNRAEVVCIDLDGFLDGENDGPFKDEKYKEKIDGDFIWVYDMIEELGVFPHNLATCSPVVAEGKVFIATSNGVDEGHLNLPSPLAPSFIALDMETGELVWERDDPGEAILHGQWASPAYDLVAGKGQAVFGGGDGWCYSYNPDDGELLWKFDLNPKDSKWILGGKGTRNAIISTPVIYDDKVFLAVGQDPEHGEGPGHLFCIDATKRGDITKTGNVWHYGDEDYNRTISTVAIKDGLLYASDLSGFLHCLDVKTGKRVWTHDLFSAIWGSPYVVDGKVYMGNEDGYMIVLEHGRTKKMLFENDCGNSVYTTPVASSGVMYLANRRDLYALQIGAKNPPKKKGAKSSGD